MKSKSDEVTDVSESKKQYGNRKMEQRAHLSIIFVYTSLLRWNFFLNWFSVASCAVLFGWRTITHIGSVMLCFRTIYSIITVTLSAQIKRKCTRSILLEGSSLSPNRSPAEQTIARRWPDSGLHARSAAPD